MGEPKAFLVARIERLIDKCFCGSDCGVLVRLALHVSSLNPGFSLPVISILQKEDKDVDSASHRTCYRGTIQISNATAIADITICQQEPSSESPKLIGSIQHSRRDVRGPQNQ